MNSNGKFKRQLLSQSIKMAAIPAAMLFCPSLVNAQEGSVPAGTQSIEEVLVTATRREESILEIPINISAVGGQQIEDLRLTGISEIARYVPGLVVLDRGPRDEVPDILVRGLNTTGAGPGFVSDTVATYFGDIPLDVDVKPVDLERVEVLIGPQGTLYGQGTLGGAIRYIPHLADSSELSGEVRGKLYSNAESSDPGGELGFTLNVPLVPDLLALRANFDRIEDPGFIDYNFVVREAGVSDPEPDFSNPEEVRANLRRVPDANGEQTDSTRVNLRLNPNDIVDVNLWYFNQETEAEGRQISNQLSFGTGEYESAYRFEEPNDYENELISLNLDLDLNIAKLTAIYGETEYSEVGQRDQTDLLLGFEYGYEAFPQFSSFTREIVDEETETYELRLVSQHEGPVSWVAGYFKTRYNSFATSEEFTPEYDIFAIENSGGVQERPDSLEYYQVTDQFEKEEALYGEITIRPFDFLSLTAGYRDYEFEVDSTGGFDIPLFRTVFDGEDPNSIIPNLRRSQGSNEGELWKFNASLDVADNSIIYYTYSEGYRNGGVNLVPACTPEELDQAGNGEQLLCAQEDEIFFEPDFIRNYEIGYKGSLFDNRLATTLAIYRIKWEDLQIATSTALGGLPITGNGERAENRGLEFTSRLLINHNWETSLTYAYTKAELTRESPGLVGDDLTALDGGRLPGSPEHQASFNIAYSTTLRSGLDLDVNYGFVFVGEVYNIVGGDEDPLVSIERDEDGNEIGREPADFGGEAIDSYHVHHLSASLNNDNWKLQAYVDNLFNEYYVTSTRATRRSTFLQSEQNGPGATFGEFTRRGYGEFVGAPRTVGLKLSYLF